jgi:nucleoside-diphosphate-sugar epimerase
VSARAHADDRRFVQDERSTVRAGCREDVRAGDRGNRLRGFARRRGAQGAGHRVRLLARSPSRVSAALAPLGVADVETRIGDVTDPVTVARALDGCNAVLHAASVFSSDPRRADEMRAVNVRGTETVLGLAHRARLDPIVRVSSELALLPPANGEVLTADSPVQQARWP